MSDSSTESMVLVNHASEDKRKLMIEKGIISGIVNGNEKDGFEDAINDQEEAQKKLKEKMV